MLSFSLVLVFLAAVNCAHVTTVQDVNGLIDKTIEEIKKSVDKIDITEVQGLALIGLHDLKRDGNCQKSTKVGIFECKAASESKLRLAGEEEDVRIRMTFEVEIDSSGHLVKYENIKNEIDFNENTTENDSYYGWVKKHLHHLKHAVTKVVEKAVHTVIQQKVREIVISIAQSVITS